MLFSSYFFLRKNILSLSKTVLLYTHIYVSDLMVLLFNIFTIDIYYSFWFWNSEAFFKTFWVLISLGFTNIFRKYDSDRIFIIVETICLTFTSHNDSRKASNKTTIQLEYQYHQYSNGMTRSIEHCILSADSWVTLMTVGWKTRVEGLEIL